MDKTFGIVDALMSLTPGAEWTLTGEDYEGITWLDTVQVQPNKKEINDEIKKLTKAYADSEYQRLRATEYPDFRDYLDGIVKDDQAQIDAYILACQAVKDKYPKP